MFSHDPWDYGTPGKIYFDNFDKRFPYDASRKLTDIEIQNIVETCSVNNEAYPEGLEPAIDPPKKRRKIEMRNPE